MADLRLPKLSDSMDEGIIATWLVSDGDEIAIGDDLVEIETDKATVVHTADADGVIEIVVPQGSSCAVGTVIARLSPSGTAAPISQVPAFGDTPEPAIAATARGSGSIPVPRSSGSAAVGRVTRVTPLARRAAVRYGVDTSRVHASGPGERVTLIDVLTAAGVDPAPDPAPSARRARSAAPAHDAGPEATTMSDQELTRTQRVIAERMTEAHSEIPPFQVNADVFIDKALQLRAELKQQVGEDAPSLNDLLIKAVALALRSFPIANASFEGGFVRFHDRINVGFAVAGDRTLVVPTIPDADTLALTDIARLARELASKVRAGTVTPAELSGGTFTVSNLGMYGMTAITPIINPPQVAILGAGAARKVLALDQGTVVEQSQLTLTLSCDHRVLYGADAARLLGAIRDLMESPLRLVR
jgi:pyruvate dehydrogenase E2 component (dihydrolipoamide acetyltransferase)